MFEPRKKLGLKHYVLLIILGGFLLAPVKNLDVLYAPDTEDKTYAQSVLTRAADVHERLALDVGQKEYAHLMRMKEIIERHNVYFKEGKYYEVSQQIKKLEKAVERAEQYLQSQ